MRNQGIINIILIITMLAVSSPGRGQHCEIIAPPVVFEGDLMNIMIRIKDNDQRINPFISGNFNLQTNIPALEVADIKITHGVGSLSTVVIANEDFTISLNGFDGQKNVQVSGPVFNEISGEITQNTTFGSGHNYFVSSDLFIPDGIVLSIEKGTNIYLGEKVNIKVSGKIIVDGTSDEPVLFKPYDRTLPWGGIEVSEGNDTSFFRYAIFTFGGDNENYVFGHSNSQPIIMIDTSNAMVDNCFFTDNPGKAMGSKNGSIIISNCLFTRCDTGGEHHNSLVAISDSYFLDMPNDGNQPVDDDNDGCYFYGIKPGQTAPSTIKRCVFHTGKDDAIDHNGAMLEISDCRIENFYHEGIAASNAYSVSVSNTLIRYCGQGIEAGYGSPQVTVNHCVLLNNEVGLRFGDSYEWGCSGEINATNSILFNNSDNIKNFDLLTQAPVPGAIDISYSMTNDPDYSTCTVCISGEPEFGPDYLLKPGSPGTGQGNDGNDMGLLYPLTQIQPNRSQWAGTIRVYPNPFHDELFIHLNATRECDFTLFFIDQFGSPALKDEIEFPAGENSVRLNKMENLPPGIYFLMLKNKGEFIKAIKVLKK